MLFVESRFLDVTVDGPARMELLHGLQQKGFTPLIQSMRRKCFEMALAFQGEVSSERQEQLTTEVEQLVARKTGPEQIGQYVKGDLFGFEDHMLFLNFDSDKDSGAGIGAGIIFTGDTQEPLLKFDKFGRAVTDVLSLIRQRAEPWAEEGASVGVEWQQRAKHSTAGYARFILKQDVDFLYTAPRREAMRDRQHAASLLEDEYVRHFLRRTREAVIEGCTSKLLPGVAGETPVLPVERLTEAGLLMHEVLISCRKTGHALFQLPSPDALAVITVSAARCSECGALVADERVEEVIAPTELALSLLEDASWLINRIHSIVRKFGVLSSEIVIGPVNAYGEAHVIVNVSGQPFLFVLRDGDLTPAMARRAVDAEIETEATHLLIVVTGRTFNESRAFLMDHAHRRARGGDDLEVLIIEGVQTAEAEIRRAFEKVSESAITESLCQLDDNLGFSMSQLVHSRFEVLQEKPAGRGLEVSSSSLPSLESQDIAPYRAPLFSTES